VGTVHAGTTTRRCPGGDALSKSSGRGIPCRI
jgi:hypothetical protein